MQKMDALFTDDILNAVLTGFSRIITWANTTYAVDATLDGQHFTLSVTQIVLSALVFRLVVGILSYVWSNGGNDNG